MKENKNKLGLIDLNQFIFTDSKNIDIENIKNSKYYCEQFIYNLLIIENLQERLNILKFQIIDYQTINEVKEYYSNLKNSLDYFCKQSIMSQIYVAMLAINNTLSNTSYAMINLESMKEVLDSKGFDENKTSLLDFILDCKFKHKFESIKIDIDMTDHSSSSE